LFERPSGQTPIVIVSFFKAWPTLIWVYKLAFFLCNFDNILVPSDDDDFEVNIHWVDRERWGTAGWIRYFGLANNSGQTMGSNQVQTTKVKCSHQRQEKRKETGDEE
jgi:hypothetical protein